jgi:hypothetical protein
MLSPDIAFEVPALFDPDVPRLAKAVSRPPHSKTQASFVEEIVRDVFSRQIRVKN